MRRRHYLLRNNSITKQAKWKPCTHSIILYTLQHTVLTLMLQNVPISDRVTDGFRVSFFIGFGPSTTLRDFAGLAYSHLEQAALDYDRRLFHVRVPSSSSKSAMILAMFVSHSSDREWRIGYYRYI